MQRSRPTPSPIDALRASVKKAAARAKGGAKAGAKGSAKSRKPRR